MAQDPLESKLKGVIFNYEDNIAGNGNFASYNKIISEGPHSDARLTSRLADVYLQKLSHGSGSIERESLITSTELTRTEASPNMIYAYGLTAALDNNSMVYGSQTISIGSGYYAAHPVKFNSLLGDRTQIKNYASKTSMGYEINYAHAINRDLVASAEDDYYDNCISRSLTKSLVNLNGNIISGTANIKMLQGGSRKSKSAWSKPAIDVDQVYTGTFDLAIEMNLTVPVYKEIREESWLPCCSGGWIDMMYYDKKGFGASAEGIFDCTCLKGLAKA